jgi:L-threonylcarbamoyladenylate synthase
MNGFKESLILTFVGYMDTDQAVNYLKEGKLILSATDTIWGIMCDATSEKAVEKVYQLKNRSETKSMVCMVSDLNMLDQFLEKKIEIPEEHINDKRPTTIIYPNPKGIAKNVISSDNAVAIRIVKHYFCTSLIAAFGKPVVSTSANISGQAHPKKFDEICDEIIKGVDLIIDLDKNLISNNPSRIIKITPSGVLTTLRE